MSIYIPGNVPSLKNSKRIVKVGKYPKLVPSKAVISWRKETDHYWRMFKKEFINQLDLSDKPYRIEFTFIRKSKHRFDYTNALDTVQDEMVKHQWIEDDNSDILLPVLRPYKYDKENHGVIINVLL